MDLVVLPPNDRKYVIQSALTRTLLSWVLAAIALMVTYYFYKNQSHSLIGWVAVFSISIAYTYYVYSLHKEFSRISENHMLRLIGIYTIIAAVIIMIYAGYYSGFNLITGDNWTKDINKAVYFSIVTFTTLGFGEFVPSNNTGRYIVASEALIGTLHMVTFVSVWLTKVIKYRA